MSMIVGNLFEGLAAPASGEAVEDLLRLGPLDQVRIERIFSSAAQTVAPVFYDQPQDEWVILLQGQARLWIEGHDRLLGPGDHLFIPARTPHWLMETSVSPTCVWLAVHLYRAAGG